MPTQRAKKDHKKRPTPVVSRKGAPATEGRAEKRRSADRPVEEGPKYTGGPKNEHGTRVARRVTCSRCGTSDHIPYVPRDATRALCRSCAAEVLKIYERGTKIRMPTRTTPCNLCGTPFELPIVVEDDGDPLCPNCLRGFTTWQGSVDVPFADRVHSTLEARPSGAVVRKRPR